MKKRYYCVGNLISMLKKNIWGWPDGLVWKLTESFTVKSRKRKYNLFIKLINPKPEDKILDVGVSPFLGRATNFLELWYPYSQNITALTNEDLSKFSEFKRHFPMVKLIQGDGKNLPFPDNYFDVVFCNAVVEHVGSYKEQWKFINEICRVGKKIFVTTPNKLFPVDSHTLIPFAHLLPKKMKFWIYKKLGRTYWADEKNLNLLTAKQFVALFPKEAKISLYRGKLLGITSSLIIFAEK